jgi:putative ABC transport system permease protein
MPVSEGYFQTLRIPLLRGRDFTPRDAGASSGVVIINKTMARRLFPEGNAIGHWLQIDLQNDRRREIVGVAGDVQRNRYHDRGPRMQMYVPYLQIPFSGSPDDRLRATGGLGDARLTMTFLVRTFGEPSRLVPQLREVVSNMDRSVPIFQIKTLNEYATDQLHDPRQYMTLLSGFSGIAALLALIGLYGLTSYAVRQRTREIGIRVALGATSRAILWLVMRHGLLLLGIGTALGVGAALAGGRLLKSALYGVTETDLMTLSAVIIALFAAGLLACYWSVRSALRIEPNTALRHE